MFWAILTIIGIVLTLLPVKPCGSYTVRRIGICLLLPVILHFCFLAVPFLTQIGAAMVMVALEAIRFALLCLVFGAGGLIAVFYGIIKKT